MEDRSSGLEADLMESSIARNPWRHSRSVSSEKLRDTNSKTRDGERNRVAGCVAVPRMMDDYLMPDDAKSNLCRRRNQMVRALIVRRDLLTASVEAKTNLECLQKVKHVMQGDGYSSSQVYKIIIAQAGLVNEFHPNELDFQIKTRR